jgi:hypothetical protein
MGVTWADSPAAAAATAGTTYSVNYFTNANTAGFPDGTVELIDPNSNGGSTVGQEPNICANIYVFYPDEEMAACCSCMLTPDGLNQLSVNNDLTSNPLTQTVLVAGAIKIVSSPATAGCQATAVSPTPAVLAWGTHILAPSTGGFWITESSFSAATLSTNELGSLQSGCKAIHLEGSGHGICSCGSVLPN